jgi:hypothetical protein
LWHHVRIELPDETTERAVHLVGQHAVHPFEPRAEIELAVRRRDGRYVLFDRGDQVTELDSSRQVLDAVFQRVHRRAFELASLLGWARFHGAVARIGSTRLVLAGPSGSGKTTLAAALVTSGGVVEGDESFLAREGHVLAVARRWHVRPATMELLPEAAWLGHAPVLDAVPPLRLVDPTEHGFEWTLQDGRVDAVVVLFPAEPRQAAVEHLDGAGVVSTLLDQSFPVTESRAAVVRQAAALALQSRGHALTGRAADPIETVHTLAGLGRSH